MLLIEALFEVTAATNTGVNDKLWMGRAEGRFAISSIGVIAMRKAFPDPRKSAATEAGCNALER